MLYTIIIVTISAAPNMELDLHLKQISLIFHLFKLFFSILRDASIRKVDFTIYFETAKRSKIGKITQVQLVLKKRLLILG